MIYTRGLSQLIFESPPGFADELLIISGYVGVTQIEKALTKQLKLNILYGMTGADGIAASTHEKFKQMQNANPSLKIYYTLRGNEVHAKCYIWKLKDTIVRALIGSANFTYQGLNFPDKEILIEVHPGEFIHLEAYCQAVFSNQKVKECLSPEVITLLQKSAQRIMGVTQEQVVVSSINGIPNTIRLSFLDETGHLPSQSGLNWGHGQGHVHPSDAYIRIPKVAIRTGFFKPKSTSQIPIDVLWDDGTSMEMYEEGNQTYNEQLYPKQLASANSKKILGIYLRKRLGVPDTAQITMADLKKYGKDYVDISVTGPYSYYIDFSKL